MPIDSPKIENNQIIGGGITPTGTILSFASEVAPDGWLVCDGQQVSRSTYAELYSVIGNRWGEGDGSTTFHLPDLRGRFLRGHDGGAGRDPDTAGRSAMNAGGNTGDNVGSIQDGATKRPNTSFSGSANVSGTTGSDSFTHTHSHNITLRGIDPGVGGSYNNTASPEITGGQTRSRAISYGSDQGPHYTETDTFGHSHSHSLDINTTATINSGGDNETRPLNANVSYIIKI